ncbi:MAG TPA: hypothetical protein VHS31_17690 [Tepidisphaeraceae bacterium]|jgi:hypothetical protein|nr:hypothetical protein [Tepidisphaeraceae bacterium]
MSDPAKPNSSDHAWEQGWEDHELQQMRRLAKLPLSEKIAWLEEAQRLMSQLTKQNSPPPAGDQ